MTEEDQSVLDISDNIRNMPVEAVLEVGVYPVHRSGEGRCDGFRCSELEF